MADQELHDIFDVFDGCWEQHLPTEAYRIVNEFLEKFDITDKRPVVLIALVRGPYYYRDHLPYYPEMFRKVHSTLKALGRDTAADLNGLSIEKYVKEEDGRSSRVDDEDVPCVDRAGISTGSGSDMGEVAAD